MTDSPVMLLLYDRPDKVRRVMERVRDARPFRLYLVADHWPDGDDKIRSRCLEAREAAEALADTAGEVARLYADRHLGCRFRPATGISGVLEKEDRVIILEDDCVPEPDFFRFCDAMLARYADQDRVMMVGGSNARRHRPSDGSDAFFSRYPQTWGWATWRRAWAACDIHLADWESARSRLVASDLHPAAIRHFTQKLDQVARGELEAWDYGWSLTLALNNGLALLPRVNLVRNIGFGPGATHTLSPLGRWREPPTAPLPPPWNTPGRIQPDEAHDDAYARGQYSGAGLAVREWVHARIRRK